MLTFVLKLLERLLLELYDCYLNNISTMKRQIATTKKDFRNIRAHVQAHKHVSYCVCAFTLWCAGACALIFMKKILVVFYSLISLSFKLQNFHCGDICKVHLLSNSSLRPRIRSWLYFCSFAHLPGNLCTSPRQPWHISPTTFAHLPSNPKQHLNCCLTPEMKGFGLSVKGWGLRVNGQGLRAKGYGQMDKG